ncbi:MAG: helicase/exodeoxyribonuclease gamma subunit [Geobacteraceae bacterium]|nr:helicase/exodeoxyribonuclease gamma subunit [Geobacteraceae bacterium]
MPLTIHTSNRMENLVEALSGVVKEPLASPFTPEVIVVQSKGMQRWLAMELSRRFGVWANGDFPFPNSMVWRLFQSVLPEVPDSSPFSPEIMTWRITGILPRFLERGEFSHLKHYLAGDSDGRSFSSSLKKLPTPSINIPCFGRVCSCSGKMAAPGTGRRCSGESLQEAAGGNIAEGSRRSSTGK